MHLLFGRPSVIASRGGWLTVVLFVCPAIGFSESLRYAPEPGSEFRYEFDIRLDLGTEETTLTGVTSYHVNKSTVGSSSDQIQLQFAGGLRQTERSKNANRPIIRPRFPQLGLRTGPIDRGTTPTSNAVTVSAKGETLALQGESHLPFLLGHLSLLPFEPLPGEGQTQWSAQGTTAIVSNNTPNDWPAFGPFAGQNNRDLRVAKTKQTYRIISEDDRQTAIEKTYELLLSPAQEDATLQLSGTGTWIFDKTENMPLSMDFRYDLTIQLSGLTVKAPLTLKYKRLTSQEIAERQAASEKREAESKRLAEQRKREAEREVTEEEKQKWLAGLRSDKDFDRVRTLNELAGRTPPRRDPEIVAAIEAFLDEPNRAVSMSAQRALKKWDPVYAQQSALESKYNSSAPLDSTGRTIDANTPLYVGQVIQVQGNHSWWKAAEITELLASGRVEVQMRDHWKERKIFDREQIQLPPEAYVQPHSPPAMTTANEPVKTAPVPPANAQPLSPVRTWKDASGRFSIEASLLLIANGNLVFSRTDGKSVTVSIDKMSEADQAFVKELSEPTAEPVNPFEPN